MAPEKAARPLSSEEKFWLSPKGERKRQPGETAAIRSRLLGNRNATEGAPAAGPAVAEVWLEEDKSKQPPAA